MLYLNHAIIVRQRGLCAFDYFVFACHQIKWCWKWQWHNVDGDYDDNDNIADGDNDEFSVKTSMKV